MKQLTSFLLLIILLTDCHVEVPTVPAAAFYFTGGYCSVPCEVSFTSMAQNSSSYLWDFGDGQSSTEANPKHVFSSLGNYAVKLIIRGDGGSSGITQTVSIQQPVVATKVWDKAFGGSNDDNLSSFTVTTDGGFLLAGNSNSGQSSDKSSPNKGDHDYWIVRTDGNGNRAWDKTYGGSGADQLRAVVSTFDGGFLLGGYSTSGAGGDKSDPNKGAEDFWIVKVDGNGNKVWDKAFGGNESDILRSILPTPDGGFLLGGYSSSGVGNDKSEASAGGADYWVVKIDKNGNKSWDKTFGGSGPDFLTSMVATLDGNVLLGGHSASGQGGSRSEASKGGDDFWSVKMDGNGNKVWDKAFGGNGNDYIFTMSATPDGGFLLGGTSTSGQGGDKSEAVRGADDYWIVRTDRDGTKLWDKTFGGASSDILFASKVTFDGGFLLGGFSVSGRDNDKSEISRGNYDYWIVRTDATGKRIWDKTLGGSNRDELLSILSTTDGSFLLGGSSVSTSDGEKSVPAKGNYDYWIVRIK